MSKPKIGLSVDKDKVMRFVADMKLRPRVKEVWLYGSRSPLSAKEHREDSDWDMVVVHDGTGYIPEPKNRGLWIDLGGRHKPNVDVTRGDAIMIYPINMLDG